MKRLPTALLMCLLSTAPALAGLCTSHTGRVYRRDVCHRSETTLPLATPSIVDTNGKLVGVAVDQVYGGVIHTLRTLPDGRIVTLDVTSHGFAPGGADPLWFPEPDCYGLGMLPHYSEKSRTDFILEGISFGGFVFYPVGQPYTSVAHSWLYPLDAEICANYGGEELDSNGDTLCCFNNNPPENGEYIAYAYITQSGEGLEAPFHLTLGTP